MHPEIHSTLNAFPKQRPTLTDAHKEIYEKEYLLNRGDEGGFLYRLIAKLEAWSHKKIAARKGKGLGPVLEIGPGTLNQVPYEDKGYDYDIVEPSDFFYQNSPHKTRIRDFYHDISDIELGDTPYKRIFTKGVLEHVADLPALIARSALLLEENGIFQNAIPSEGGFLWGASWRLTTALSYKRRTGLDYKTVMRHEHINTAQEILDLIRYFFGNVELTYFPFPGLHVSVYIYIEASKPNRNLAESYLETI